MKLLSIACVSVVSSVLFSCGGESSPVLARAAADPTRSPLEVVNARMAAYNGHDLEAFLATYAEDVEVYTYPDDSLGGGLDHMRSIFEPMFEEGSVQVTLHHQIAKDGYVINHETVTDEGEETEYVSIYEVRDGLIESVRFVRD